MNKYEVEIYSMGKVEANLFALSLLFVPIMWPAILSYIVDEICDKFSRYKFLKNIKICIKFEDREDMILISKLKNQKDNAIIKVKEINTFPNTFVYPPFPSKKPFKEIINQYVIEEIKK